MISIPVAWDLRNDIYLSLESDSGLYTLSFGIYYSVLDRSDIHVFGSLEVVLVLVFVCCTSHFVFLPGHDNLDNTLVLNVYAGLLLEAYDADPCVLLHEFSEL